MEANEQQTMQETGHMGHWYVIPNRVRYIETDQMGVVFHSNYLSWFEMGRTEYIRACGMPYTQIEEEGNILLPLTDASMKFVRPARYDNDVLIYARITHYDRLRVQFMYKIYAVPNELITYDQNNGKVIPATLAGWQAELPAGFTLLVEGQTDHVWVTRGDFRPTRADRKLPALFAVLATHVEHK
jgi:acyl-CoA thioester hydrolase